MITDEAGLLIIKIIFACINNMRKFSPDIHNIKAVLSKFFPGLYAMAMTCRCLASNIFSGVATLSSTT